MTTSALLSLSESAADLVAAVAPSVVQVHGRRRPASGLVFGDTAIVTTTRALGGDDGLRVRAHDGQMFDAEFAGWDPATELAVLKVPGIGAHAVQPADTPARVGQLAIAIARSWSNAITASLGNVAVIGGPLRTGRQRVIEEVIRTTAPMHEGFAGGPLVGASGRVIGISTAATIRGLAVVIPAAIAWRTAGDILAHGSPKRGFLGVTGQSVEVADRQRDELQRDRALLVAGVTSASPAETAGILVGDLIFELDGQPVQSADDLLELLRADRIGRAVSVRVLRGGARQEVTVAIAERPRS
jgi:S1-C subfamily serine protease